MLPRLANKDPRPANSHSWVCWHYKLLLEKLNILNNCLLRCKGLHFSFKPSSRYSSIPYVSRFFEGDLVSSCFSFVPQVSNTWQKQKLKKHTHLAASYVHIYPIIPPAAAETQHFSPPNYRCIYNFTYVRRRGERRKIGHTYVCNNF